MKFEILQSSDTPLEEDSDKTPLIEYEYGKNGKPFLTAKNKSELEKYRRTLDKSTGGDYHYKLIKRISIYIERKDIS